jgi:hypothetical protein
MDFLVDGDRRYLPLGNGYFVQGVSRERYGVQLNVETVPVWIVRVELEILPSNQTPGTQTITPVMAVTKKRNGPVRTTWEKQWGPLAIFRCNDTDSSQGILAITVLAIALAGLSLRKELLRELSRETNFARKYCESSREKQTSQGIIAKILARVDFCNE